MKKTVQILRYEASSAAKEYDFIDKPTFHQVYNYRRVIGIYPNFSKRFGRNSSGDVEEILHFDYKVFVGNSSGLCQVFDLSEQDLLTVLNKRPVDSNPIDSERFQAAQTIVGLCINETIAEKTFKEYYNKYLIALTLPE